MQLDRAFAVGAVLGPDTVVLKGRLGDSLVVPVVGSSTSFDAVTRTLTIPLASVPENGARTGRALLSIPDGRGSYKLLAQSLSDSVGPWIDSAKIVENLEGRLVDTVVLWTSEPMVAPSKAWFMKVLRAGAPLSTASVVVDSAWFSDATTGQWTVVVRTGAIAAGDQILLDGALVRDLKDNAAENCDALYRELKLWVRQAPVSRAWISDSDGDGAPDLVSVVYKRVLRAGETPDAVTVRFGMVDSVRVVPVAATSGDSVVRIPLSVPYSRSTTVGSGIGGFGSLVLTKSGDSLKIPLADSVAANLLTANLLYGSGVLDTLSLVFSEALDTVAGTSHMQILKAAAQNLPAKGSPLVLGGTMWKFVVDTNAVVPGDSVRPTASGRFVDGSGRPTSPLHPWVEVQGMDRAPNDAWYKDVDGDGAVDQITMRWARAPRSRPSFALLWPSTTGGFDTILVAANSWTLQPGGLVAILPVGPFDKGVTSSPTTDLGRQISDGFWARFAIRDSVSPVLLSAKLAYGASSTDADSLRLVFSEVVAQDVGTTGLLRKDTPEAAVPFVGPGYSLDGVNWTVSTSSAALFVGDSIRPSSVAGFYDASANRPSALHPWVYVGGSERPPQMAWYKDVDGDGAVDHVVVKWTYGPRTRPDLSFLWPNGAGGFDSTVVVGGVWNLDADGRTLTLPVGPFKTGVTSSSTTDLGRQNSAGTITSFPIYDSVPAVLTGARVSYASSDAEMDTLKLAWSEPIVWSGSAPLVYFMSKGLAGPVVGSGTVVRPDALGGTILFDPDDSTLTVLRKGDLLRLAPKSTWAQADAFGNAAEDPTRWVEVALGRRPPRFEVVFDPNKIRYLGWPLDVGPALQIWVRARGETVWIDYATGLPVPATQVAQGVGPTIALNQPLRGQAYMYDNQGTFVAKVDLSLLGAAFYTEALPKDASNQYEVRVQWNGKTAKGKPAASGVYMMRLVLWQNIAAEDEAPEYRVVNNLYRLGWEVPAK